MNSPEANQRRQPDEVRVCSLLALFDAVKIDDLRDLAYNEWINSGAETEAPPRPDAVLSTMVEMAEIGVDEKDVRVLSEQAYRMMTTFEEIEAKVLSEHE